PSGVWVNGTFYEKNDAIYGHIYNYPQGQVVFTSGAILDRGDTIQLSYSAKDVAVEAAGRKKIFALHNDYFDNDGMENYAFPSGTEHPLAVYVEMGDHNMEPLALGGGVIAHKTAHIHIVSNDQYEAELDNISDAISYKEMTT